MSASCGVSLAIIYLIRCTMLSMRCFENRYMKTFDADNQVSAHKQYLVPSDQYVVEMDEQSVSQTSARQNRPVQG